MFDILNLVYLGAILVSSITLYPEGATKLPTEKDAMVEASFYREWWREDGDGKCSYQGVVVPYVRDWEEVNKTADSETIKAAEPNKIAGYVALVNRKVCKDKAPEVIFRAGVTRGIQGELNKHAFFPAGDMLETPADKMPPWLPQAVMRVERLAKTNPAAQAFLNASASELDKALPARHAAPSSVDAASNPPVGE